MNAAPRQSASARDLLAWYDAHRRELPWRVAAGVRPDPYRVWLSEIMLQQTTVATVKERYERFLRRWPTVQALAAASLDDVLHEWQGLGYYARARNLHACARIVAERHGGAFPDDEDGLRALPGIGAYTAAAIAAIAFDRKATAVDGNVERVMARLNRIETPLPQAKAELAEAARAKTPDARCGDFAQALMDLGATVCTPRRPRCAVCPWQGGCQAFAAGDAERLPRRTPKPPRPTRHGVVFWLEDRAGRVLLRKRPSKGLLAGLYEFPSTPWRDEAWEQGDALGHAPAGGGWSFVGGEVVHVFTHFRLVLRVAKGVADDAGGEGVWAKPADFADYALPSVMKKVSRWAENAPSLVDFGA